ncbi:hypothetical protein [Ideonella oryzae]|uniref:Uncharacterized protein n=1 Tax=Ideonella oryzae TaxID=2937441 RepID=A0ABT1BT68_9BURK|nr:hypothetical protein [Ideonella oryzae]MCO5979373.1 hypothetical protein [Ideonella oryzae]
MPERTFSGQYVHKYSGLTLSYVCHYHFTTLGIVYVARAGFGDGRTATITHGVKVWGLRAIPPRRKVEQSIHETIDIIDIDKLRTAIEEGED